MANKEILEEFYQHMLKSTPVLNEFERASLKLKVKVILSSRDTYWKERVEEAVKAERERILKACDVNSFLRDEDHEDFVVYLTDIETITKATPITNEDNLK